MRDYNKTLEEIKSVLRDEDLMGLIRGCGAPLDEYDSEALMIFERVNRLDSIEQIRDKLWDVFYIQFCYGTVYHQVDGVLTEVYKEVVAKEEADRQIGLKHKYSVAANKIRKILNS